MTTIDLARARELLKQAVETQGRDFVYQHPEGPNGCWYQARPDLYPLDHPKARTGCLVGVALDLAGETRHRDAQMSARQLFLCGKIEISQEASWYLQTAQASQDAGRPWGEAYDEAERLDEAEWLAAGFSELNGETSD